MSDFTHLDERGRARMVDVSEKQPTHRMARAGATVHADPAVIARIRDLTVAKGPVLEIARIAGIQAAKRTSDLIPLCHPLPIDGVEVDCQLGEDRVDIEATARCFARTGIEMEAMTAAAVAALTVYDMCKALDRTMVLTDVRLLEKSGGRSGHFRREG
ncbi:MAG: cyclic pyranopterin monophosphate synthase MoaC [Myxococcota bacterium]|jgi:cyclic pyranopterin phosphate synthase|nr:cyclic pyranopterin monophosphate synthase MoaC [Myxococcota bacterium]